MKRRYMTETYKILSGKYDTKNVVPYFENNWHPRNPG